MGANAQEHAEFFCRWASQGLQVVLSLGPESLTAGLQLPERRIDAWLILLTDQQQALKTALSRQSPVPLVFADPAVLNEPAKARYWSEQLRHSLELKPELPVSPVEPVVTAPRPASRVWVLGASLGGPDAWIQFLSPMPADIPAAFVVAQHIEAYSLDVLARRIARETRLKAIKPTPLHGLQHGEVLLVSPEQQLKIEAGSQCLLVDSRWPAPYSPNISSLMLEVGHRFGAHSGAIIFTGTCNDGASACSGLHQLEGQIWTQSAESCVHSSMPDQVRATGFAGRSGTPAQLAADFIRIYYKRLR